ncbi:MAG: hypothetical protein K0Q73_6491 [Paenibacillus sp.]|jgi:hypothetical protein|nr:hypothetical protein [Paenibacillus sp.]
MDFLNVLSGFIGQNVEVFFTNQFITGKLSNVSADNGTFTVDVTSGSYAGPGTSTVISLLTMDMVRILPS